jgi:hypothetical protein
MARQLINSRNSIRSPFTILTMILVGNRMIKGNCGAKLPEQRMRLNQDASRSVKRVCTIEADPMFDGTIRSVEPSPN